MSDTPPDDSRWQPWQMGELPAASSHSKRRREQSAQQEKTNRDDFLRQQALRQQQLAAEQKKARQEGYDAGFAEGLKAGREAGLEKAQQEGQQQQQRALSQFNTQAQALLNGLQQALDHLDDDLADTLVDVTLAAARQLTDDAFEAQPQKILALIHLLLQEEPLFGLPARLQLHPDDMSLIDTTLRDTLNEHRWQLQADAGIQRGGCRIVGPEGELDATREARWHALLKRSRRFGNRPGLLSGEY